MPRGRTLTGEQLALARAAAVLPILRVAVRSVIEKVAEEGAEHEWSNDWFTGLFKASGFQAAKAGYTEPRAPMLAQTVRRLKRRAGRS